MTRNARLGRDGEQVAATYLARLGWCVLDRNWQPSDPAIRGELDIVALDGATVVVCEVKTRRGTGAGTPIDAVTARKIAQIGRLAGAWLAEHPSGTRRDIRLDVLGLVWRPGAIAPTIEHRRDVAR